MVDYIEHPELGKIRLQRRRGSKSIRISISQGGEIRLSIPYRVSISAGLAFLEQKREWLKKHSVEQVYLDDGAKIGPHHTLQVIVVADNAEKKTRYTDSKIIVYIPESADADHVQAKLLAACKRLLQKQASKLLLPMLQDLATQHRFKVSSIKSKHLKSRWGSCSSLNEIILNSYLVQLPYELIEYVMFHELVHTIHHNHSDSFWVELEKYVPDYKKRKKLIKKFPTTVFDMHTSENFMA